MEEGKRYLFKSLVTEEVEILSAVDDILEEILKLFIRLYKNLKGTLGS